MSHVFALFHLNLAYSSIEEEERPAVIKSCYEPLLDLIESSDVCIGIELSAWTLNQISKLSPEWIERFSGLLRKGKCELIGSGYVQLIGPLVPYEVNLWNQRIGLEEYERILNVQPELVLVNEMAYSSGMVGVYEVVGYKGLVMDKNNVCLAMGKTVHDSTVPVYADGGDGHSLPVLWTDSILFQKFQRFSHGDIRLNEYVDYFQHRMSESNSPVSVYANDAEIFDYRPGRFLEEPQLHHEGEWNRIGVLLAAIKEQPDVSWLSPSESLKNQCKGKEIVPEKLTSAKLPIPVKKQAKYNVSRWAITGRNDLWINTLCHRIFLQLKKSGGLGDASSQRRLCEFWSSDLRTHITTNRWKKAEQGVVEWAKELGVSAAVGAEYLPLPAALISPLVTPIDGFHVELDPENILLKIQTNDVHVELNLRRGLAIHSLAFREHDFISLIGTLPQGYFHSIELGADFYSGGSVVELLTEHQRITDLERVTPLYWLEGNNFHVRGEVETPKGKIVKEFCIAKVGGSVSASTFFPDWGKPYGSVRIGTLTLLPDAFNGPLRIGYTVGGKEAEEFLINEDVAHQQPASSFVTASSGLSGEGGEIHMGDDDKRIVVTWSPSECAVFPMMAHTNCPPSALTRLSFSLCEIDETYSTGGDLPGFSYQLKPG